MKIANHRAPPARASKEQQDHAIRVLLESVEEIHEKLDALEWGTEVPAQVAREIRKLDETLNWRCLHVFEQRLARMEAALERVERRLP